MPVDQETVDTLTSQFTLELDKLKQLQAEADERRKQESEEKASKHQTMLEKMLLMQAADEKRREDRRKFWTRFILGPSGVLAVVGGIVVGYFKATAPDAVEPEDVKVQVEAAEETVTKAVEERVGAVEQHLDKNDKKIERTVEILLDQQVQQSDGHDDIVKRIEKAHPQTKRIGDAPSVQEGRKKAKAIKDARKDKDLGYNPADPLADLK